VAHRHRPGQRHWCRDWRMVWPQEGTARTVRDVHAAAARGPWAGRVRAQREEQPDARHL